MTVPSDPPASVTPAAFKTWAQNVSDTAQDHETRVDALESATSPLYFSANEFILATGVPSLTSSTTARWPVWFLDAASREGITNSFRIPSGWTTVNLKILWSQLAAGSGNVVWIPVYEGLVSGETLDGADVIGSGVTAAAPATNVIATTTLVSGLSVTAGDLFSLRIDRDAPAAGDTLPNDCIVLGVLVEKV